MFDFFWKLVSFDIGIDLGTVNTLVLVDGKGIVVREPSVVALHKKSRQILAIGTEAKGMLGYFIQRVHQNPKKGLSIPKIPKPRVVIGIPSGVTEVERRAVQDAALTAGARVCYLIEEPMAAAIGAGLPIEEPEGTMIVDIGGGTTEIAGISLGGVVINRSLRVAGDELDEDIINYMRMRYGLIIGEKTAEDIKIEIGSASPLKEEKEAVIRGRDLQTGLPKSIKVSSVEIREALMGTINQIISAISGVLEETPPELTSDIMERGVMITGGGALLKGFDKRLAEETKMPILVADDPLTTVVRGCGKVLQNLDLLTKVRVTGGLR